MTRWLSTWILWLLTWRERWEWRRMAREFRPGDSLASRIRRLP